LAGLFRWLGKDDARIIDDVVLRILYCRPGHQLPQFPRIGYDTENTGSGCCLGGAEVDPVLFGAASSGEVAGERPQGNLVGARRLSHADAAEATGLVDLGACQKEHHDPPLIGYILKYLPAARIDMKGQVTGDS